jgi:hypothetical protein
MKVKEKNGGRDRDRTGDPLLAKQVLSQLSYTPTPNFPLILDQLQILPPLQTSRAVFSVPKVWPINFN